jgi:hypothetical protein
MVGLKHAAHLRHRQEQGRGWGTGLSVLHWYLHGFRQWIHSITRRSDGKEK